MILVFEKNYQNSDPHQPKAFLVSLHLTRLYLSQEERWENNNTYVYKHTNFSSVFTKKKKNISSVNAQRKRQQY